jgi:hypothetical protein
MRLMRPIVCRGQPRGEVGERWISARPQRLVALHAPRTPNEKRSGWTEDALAPALAQQPFEPEPVHALRSIPEALQ